jgi:hypothetical protein
VVFEVLTAVSKMVAVFWDVAPCVVDMNIVSEELIVFIIKVIIET